MQEHVVNALLFPSIMLLDVKFGCFDTNNIATFGIWALDHILTGEEENILRSNFV